MRSAVADARKEVVLLARREKAEVSDFDLPSAPSANPEARAPLARHVHGKGEVRQLCACFDGSSMVPKEKTKAPEQLQHNMSNSDLHGVHTPSKQDERGTNKHVICSERLTRNCQPTYHAF